MKMFFKILLFTLSLVIFLNAQHRGDNLSFQGLDLKNENSVDAAALGNAFTGHSGSLDALFFNPAGLASVSELSVMINGNTNTNLWRENQAYRSNRQFTTFFFNTRWANYPKS